MAINIHNHHVDRAIFHFNFLLYYRHSELNLSAEGSEQWMWFHLLMAAEEGAL